MNEVIFNKDLWNLPNEQIAMMTKGRHVRIVMKNGDTKEVYVHNLFLAANSPHLFSGFITRTKDNEKYEVISLPLIDYVELL